jgi:hypothetical protein
MKIEGNNLEDSIVTVFITMHYPANGRYWNEGAKGRRRQNLTSDTLILPLERNFSVRKN